MTASAIVTGTFGALMCIVGMIMLPRVWGGYLTRKETRFRGQMRSHGELSFIWWPFGDVTRRGLVRSFVPLMFAVCGGVAGYWVAELTAGPDPYHSHTARLAAVATVAWFAVGFGLMLTVMFFNWPKWIVPPGQRGEPGAVSEWRTARARRRRHR